MKRNKILTAVIIFTAVFFLCALIHKKGDIPVVQKYVDHQPQNYRLERKNQKENENVSEITSVTAIPENLYSMSAALMDADTGRVLCEKSGYTERANASTTKVLTCILAIENAAGDDYVLVSKNAALQPEVKLGMKEGEQYYLEDLLMSLILQSHNDTAVAIAEHIGGSTEGFARMMNQKAKEIGCENTYFITPNGLDAQDSGGTHHTTAVDLARIMRYAIQNPVFLKIAQTREYSFSDISHKRKHFLSNTNAFLDMEKGVLAGKTGYTGDAGYCYVCACKIQNKTFIVSLLGCGWPNNRGYKWKDTKKLLAFGDENFEIYLFKKEFDLPEIPVENGIGESFALDEVTLKGSYDTGNSPEGILIGKGEEITYQFELPKKISAPVKKGKTIGYITGIISSQEVYKIPVTAEKNVLKINRKWYIQKIFHDFFHS